MEKVWKEVSPASYVAWAEEAHWTAAASNGQDGSFSWHFHRNIPILETTAPLDFSIDTAPENAAKLVAAFSQEFDADAFVRKFVADRWGSVDSAPWTLSQLSTAVSTVNYALEELNEALDCPQLEDDLAAWLAETRYHYAIPNQPGYYSTELFASYDDALWPSALKDILEAGCPRDTFIDILCDMYSDSRDEVMGSLEDEAADAMCMLRGIEELGYIQTQALQDFLSEHFFISEPIDHFLKQEESVVIVLDTGDANTDFSLNTHFPHYNGDDSPMDERSSLVWLANQQGYAKPVLEAALNEGDMRDPNTFLETCRVEMANAGSDMLATVFLVRMTVHQLLRLNALIKLGEKHMRENSSHLDLGTIVLGKNTTVGLCDLWYGAGGPLEIALEKDVTLPINLIWGAKPDGLTSGVCKLKDIYGMSDAAFTDSVLSLNVPPELEDKVTELAF